MCQPSGITIAKTKPVHPQSLPENTTVCSFIIVQINGTDKYVLCFDLSPANATKSPSVLHHPG